MPIPRPSSELPVWYVQASPDEFLAYLASLPPSEIVGSTRLIDDAPVARWLQHEHNPTRFGAELYSLEMTPHLIAVQLWTGAEVLYRSQGWMLGLWYELLKLDPDPPLCAHEVTAAEAQRVLKAQLEAYATAGIDVRDADAVEPFLVLQGILAAGRRA